MENECDSATNATASLQATETLGFGCRIDFWGECDKVRHLS